MLVRASRGALALGLAMLLPPAAVGAAAPTDPSGRHQTVLGRSVDGRPIVAIEVGDFDASKRVLVVGWENHTLPAATAFAVELPAGSLSVTAVSRYASAVVAVGR